MRGTADGDMRQGLNNLEATPTGFGLVNADNMFRVCDQPHPLKVTAAVKACLSGDIDTACEGIQDLFALSLLLSQNQSSHPLFARIPFPPQVCDQPHPLKFGATVKACLSGDIDTACEGIRDLFALGYAASDIITTLFRIVKNYDMPEFLKLKFIRVSRLSFASERIVKNYDMPEFLKLEFIRVSRLSFASARIVKNYDMPEFLKLEFIRVSRLSFASARWADGCTGRQRAGPLCSELRCF
ncbi:unnamed protein product [Closterium sp. NIES-65]|nr:unnamed protein product [Closterium sp. NIES-65]